MTGNFLTTASDDAGVATDGAAPTETSLPVGVGFTTGPSTFLVGGTLDFPLDEKLTFGPSVQWGIDEDVDIATVCGQLKYYLPMTEGDEQSFLLPYVTGGVGVASLDKKGSSRDSGLLLNAGAGVRYLTGENYRIGSEARLNILPDKLADERVFLSFELLQVVITF